MATRPRVKPPKFWKKAKPKVCPYTFVVVTRQDWPDKVTKSSIRSMIEKVLKSKHPEKVYTETWFFSVPKIPHTKIFRLDKKRNTLSLCVTVRDGGELHFPKSSSTSFAWK